MIFGINLIFRNINDNILVCGLIELMQHGATTSVFIIEIKILTNYFEDSLLMMKKNFIV